MENLQKMNGLFCATQMDYYTQEKRAPKDSFSVSFSV